ncbi:baculoviral IAP repeat-containing protein 5-like [Emydura macquarii macquarii]|uniref:baculoviral IAP repeat-containing protein 5-like n=1 Tax=Emydura macquarii macquarii TaxID=1129001 RepID=UPI00352B9E2E
MGRAAADILPTDWKLYRSESRLATYCSWPFTEDCACTPERMAAAGFIHCPSENGPDVVQCFFCFKELEGWEPEDEPMVEHKKHSPGCAFLSLRKNLIDLTLQEFLKLDKERMRNMTKKQISQQTMAFKEEAKHARRSMEKLV